MIVKHFIEDKLLVFEVIEEIDHHQVEKIRDRADYEIQRLMPKKVVFDFIGVRFMDSAGIGFILGRYKTINVYGGKVEIINVNEKIKRIFNMAGISKIIEIKDDSLNDNLNSLKQIS